jgi:hypothetical protein
MVYFIKATQTGKGMLVSDKKLGFTTVLINGKEHKFRDQGKMGFIATVEADARTFNLKQGDALPFNLTDKKVRTKDGKELDLVWATPE